MEAADYDRASGVPNLQQDMDGWNSDDEYGVLGDAQNVHRGLGRRKRSHQGGDEDEGESKAASRKFQVEGWVELSLELLDTSRFNRKERVKPHIRELARQAKKDGETVVSNYEPVSL